MNGGARIQAFIVKIRIRRLIAVEIIVELILVVLENPASKSAAEIAENVGAERKCGAKVVNRVALP